MFTSALMVAATAAMLVEASPLQSRAIFCPDLTACNGNNRYDVQLGQNGVQCNYLRYGPGPGREITGFRCYYDSTGTLLKNYFNDDVSDGICPGLNTGNCPVVTTTSVAPPVVTTPAPPPVTQGRRINPNGNGGKCLDVQGAKFANGTPVQIYDCNGTPAQAFEWNQASTKIRVKGTNFCLDAGSNPGNGIGMKIWTCYDNLPAQQWYRTDDLRFAVEGKGLCLDLTDGSLQNGRQTQTWQCGNGNNNQRWTEAYY